MPVLRQGSAEGNGLWCHTELEASRKVHTAEHPHWILDELM